MPTYIRLEDALEKIKNANMTHVNMIELYSKVHSLPSISFEEMIKEMIEELACSYDVETNSKIWKMAIDSHISILKELLNKLPK